MYAIVCQTLKMKADLDQIIDDLGLLRSEKEVLPTRELAEIYLYEQLFGLRRRFRCPTKDLRLLFDRHKQNLKKEVEGIYQKHSVSNITGYLELFKEVAIPRYVRVNTHQMTIDEAIQYCTKEGYVYIDTVEDPKNMNLKEFGRDRHIPDLLVFAPRTDLHAHPLYQSGKFIFQDKASCFPAYILSPPANAHVIDGCAAPGNKTSHLSAIMNNTGQIYAFDMDMKRINLLKSLTQKAGYIDAEQADFLKVDPLDPKYAEVEYVLLDPSCSGSGMPTRIENSIQDKAEMSEERLDSLAEFQVAVIEHAFKFPKVKRVSYSTCSKYIQENEGVVQTILDRHPDFALATRDTVLPNWERRGLPEGFTGSSKEERADSVVRADAQEDLMTGFFVACFVRQNL
ncbi:S-adenosyl-L-methionine-dependent methyltransferase [Syncephalastrum racemosum]|uniref:S-adenosyl-L-methionine-dependent methyltransferase n=1 Tax=Syncephalastrum racemosum TaxID=13706 RepID=A0A1X2H517_SYNRA|nr:S-adenosyl-L-methionine-dependent methyltransferase [Syncephalastrum racemosum]